MFSLNITSNLLGLSNAATPIGIEAMKKLSKALADDQLKKLDEVINSDDSTKADKDNTTTTTEPDETTTKKPITIDGTGGKQDSISWQEIKDAANKANKS